MSSSSKSKSKSKDKPSPRGAKEQQKALKPSGLTGNGTPTSAYNPISGTFHTLETASSVASLPSSHSNIRFRNIDDPDDHSGSSHGNEYDSISNNGSSVDLEDLKEKMVNTNLRHETVPPAADNDKREKIRQKNEKKHQRQREKRAQELHERCCGYLMSRKLELLSQQLVAMGFSAERATSALISNEGKLEESVSWLFEGGEEEIQKRDMNSENGANLKINITEELSRIEEMEIRYKCSKQIVEKTVVDLEGDLEKVEETLRKQKQETPLTSPLSEEPSDSRSLINPPEKIKSLEKATASITSVTIQQRRNERDFNYTRSTLPTPGYQQYQEPDNRNLISVPVKTMQQTSLMEKRSWQVPATGPNLSVPSYSHTSSAQQIVTPPSAKSESRYYNTIRHDGRNTQQQPMVREPVIMLQRPESLNNNNHQHFISGTSPPPQPPPGLAGEWYQTQNNGQNIKIMKSNSNFLYNQNTGNHNLAQSPISQRFYQQNGDSHQQFHQSMVKPVNTPPPAPPRVVGNSSSPFTVPSSPGLFSGWGSLGNWNSSSSNLDWNTGSSMPQYDYSSIDWSVELNSPLSSSRPIGTWKGISSLFQSQEMRVDKLESQAPAPEQTSMDSGGSREWTSPFAGSDIFSAPIKFVSSPSP